MILFHSLHVAPKQDYLDFIHFHSFQFLYFKTFNQGYLIPFHSIPFFSIPLPYLNTFHSIHFISIPLWLFHSTSQVLTSQPSLWPLPTTLCPSLELDRADWWVGKPHRRWHHALPFRSLSLGVDNRSDLFSSLSLSLSLFFPDIWVNGWTVTHL